MKQVIAAHVMRREDLAPDRQVVSLSVGPHGGLVALSSDPPLPPRGLPTSPLSYRVHHWRDGTVAEPHILDLQPTEERLALAQPLPSGRWLLVNSRTGRLPRRVPRENGFIYSERGQVLGSFMVGDGVQYVHATADGYVWVGFFDEGVLDGSEPSRHGLVCFDPAGSIVFRYTDLAKSHGLRGMVECEALNATSETEVWAHASPHYPVVRVRQRRDAEVWRIGSEQPVCGTRAFAVRGEHVLFSGGLLHRGRLFTATFGSDTFEEVQAVSSTGEIVPWREKRGGVSFARGSLLFVYTDTDLYVVDAAQLDGASHCG